MEMCTGNCQSVLRPFLMNGLRKGYSVDKLRMLICEIRAAVLGWEYCSWVAL